MHHHRAATFLLGLWLAGLIAMTFVATRNFRTADVILNHPAEGAAKLLAPLSRSDARLLLRHEASELNRLYFNTFEWCEIVIGSVLVLLVMRMTNPSRPWRLLALGLLIITLIMHFTLTPQITFIGQTLDFIDPNADSPARAYFWRLHSAYSGAEVLKALCVMLLTGRLLFAAKDRRAKSRDSHRLSSHHDQAEVVR